MTDTGQVPGEGLPENAGTVEQPGAAAHGAYAYLSDSPAEEEDLLLPGAQGAWGHEVPPPAPEPVVEAVAVGADGVAPEVAGAGETPVTGTPAMGTPVVGSEAPVVEPPVAVSEAPVPVAEAPSAPVQVADVPSAPGQGADVPSAPVSGEAVAEAPAPVAGEVPAPVEPVAPAAPLAAEAPVEPVAPAAVQEPVSPQAPAAPVSAEAVTAPSAAPAVPAAQAAAPRRPLHLGPPIPDASASPVRSLADRGPAGAPVRQQPSGPQTTGPEYLDVPRLREMPPQGAAPWGAQVQAPVQAPVQTPAQAPVQTPVEAPVEAQTPVSAGAVPAETVVPAEAAQAEPVDPAQAAVTRLATEAVAVEPQPQPPAEVPEAPVAVAEEAQPAPVPEAAPVPEPAPVVEAVVPVAEAAPEVVEPEATPAPAVDEVQAAEPLSGPQIAQPVQPEQGQGQEHEELAPVETGETVGQFVPVDGTVPTTPHLAPTPPQPIILPAQEPQQPEPEVSAAPADPAVPTVPAPREADPAPLVDVAQHAEDLDTRGATDQDEEPPADATAEAQPPQPPTGPAAPPYDDAEREAVLKVMRERRDIRNGFRSDPIPHEVLLRVLEAAHTAPSVGHSQPWDFVVIRSADTRRAMHELAMRQREAYAKSLPKGRAKQFKELKIEAILDTPVNIVVTADPTRGGRHTLGRHTQPQMAPYSSALAVENLWLAARAEGLGVGWVSFFDEREMVRALGLPEHLEVVAYLCVGYVDEFPDEPELMQAGWSKRRPLSWVVHEETYGRRALPGEEPHDLLAETVAQIRPLDAKALGEAWERQKRMTKPAGALGMLEIISAQLSGLSRQCPPPIPEPAAVAIFAGDHGVHAQGVTPWPQEVTAQMVANFLGGGAVCNAFANQVGAEVCIVDVGVAADLPATPGLLPRKVRPGTADMTTGPALTREEVKQAIEVGIDTARDLVAAGNKALLTGEMGIANTTASAALISVFTGADPAEVTGRGTGINDETLARKTEVVRRAIELHQPDPADPIGVLAAFGGLEHAAMVGLLLGGASLRTPVILDGVSAGAAALVARAIAPEVLAACIAGHRSAEPGHVAALNKLGLRPLVDLDLRLGEGTGALLALPLVQSTARAMHEVATFDSAGVTEK
ncbi:nicotinate-nucleotide--dimethylbenzimidazole phosphoribosyltransferase [Streptomyces flavalbus]|uniref:Nicotinate-nucleotide--dimethylbenzimidazole phosphoribosyltransferase n=1 Tax=Streptomyces flavalbus TaxID=2665155 RepID=A0ABW2W2U2_9ACTN